MAKLLIVDDDEQLVSILKSYLEREMHTVDCCITGSEALHMMRLNSYDVILLDLVLPEVDGVAVCRSYRDAGGTAKVLMLTGRKTTGDRVVGLDAGADDYLTKPFQFEELLARIRALLRRPAILVEDVITIGSLTLNNRDHTISLSGKALSLAPREFALLEFFMRNPNQVFSPETLLDRVWDAESESDRAAVRMCINRIRKKLQVDQNGSPDIETVFGVGYKLVLPEEPSRKNCSE